MFHLFNADETLTAVESWN